MGPQLRYDVLCGALFKMRVFCKREGPTGDRLFHLSDVSISVNWNRDPFLDLFPKCEMVTPSLALLHNSTFRNQVKLVPEHQKQDDKNRRKLSSRQYDAKRHHCDASFFDQKATLAR